MIRRGLPGAICLGLFGFMLAGCSGGPVGGDVTLAQAGGLVKFKGAPLAGATVTFIPEKGPLATGTTDLEGKFKLTSGGMAGVAVGKCKVSITAIEPGTESASSPATTIDTSRPPANEEEAKKRMAAMDTMKNMQMSGKTAESGPKWIIPQKYGDPESSGLKATVETDVSKNQFTFEISS